jgi:hypothetical protein
MSKAPGLHPTMPGEIATALAFAQQFEGAMRVQHANDAMAQIAADRLVRHIEQSSFVVTKKPSGAAPAPAAHLPNRTD